VADLARRAVRPGEDPAVDDVRGGDPGADRHHEHVPVPPTGTEPGLGQAASPHVVTQGRRQPQPFAHQIA
jgi:hypothetical protein